VRREERREKGVRMWRSMKRTEEMGRWRKWEGWEAERVAEESRSAEASDKIMTST
jgi:hypothetical protein